MNRPNILVVIDHLAFGGAGRVCSIFVNGLVERNYNVTVCASTKYHPINYHLSEKVQIMEWYDPEPVKHNLFGKIANMWRRRKYYRRALKETNPDLIIAFTHYIYFLVKQWSCGCKAPIIVSDHTSMGRDLGIFFNYVRRKYYKNADFVSVLTDKDAKLLGDTMPNKGVIYNPVTYDSLAIKTERRKNIICVGRKDFWSVKGFDRMIEIWAKLASRYPEWTLEIIGPGTEDSDETLKLFAERLDVANRVSLIGELSDMQTIYQRSSIFALPSRVEGFPMVLLEAMSQGCACVSFSMQGAIEEMVNDGVDGSIVDDGDIEAFARKLEELMTDEDKRECYSANASENVQRFSKETFIDRWEGIIQNILSSK